MNCPIDSPTTSLCSLRHGDRALVVGVEADAPKLGAKLAARGLVPGVEVGVLRTGDPLLVVVDEARWALTQSDAKHVHVDLIQTKRPSILRRLWSR